MRIVQATVEILKADVGALLRVKDANYADILVAYDHAMRRPIPAMLSLNLEQQITLVNAIERKQQRPLFVDRNVEELEDLYSRLDVSQMGPAYFQPLMRNDELIAILVVALPYGKRELRDAERELLKGVGIISGSLLALSNAAEDAMARAEERAIQAVVAGVSLEEIGEGDLLERQQEMQSSLDAARFQTEALQKQVATLKLELDDERTRLTALLGDTQEGLSISQRIVALNDEQDKLRNERDELAQRLQDAETALVSMTATDQSAMVTAQIETSNRERRDLEQEIESLRAQLEELRSVNNETVSETATDVINEMSRERERLLSDRNVLDARLTDIQGQLTAMGIEGGEQGLAQLVQQLYDQKSTLQARTDALRVERDALLNERRRFEQRIRKEEERETQIETMEAEIRHLATDREAITRQRDAMRQERKQLADKVDKMKQQRARLLADLSVYEDDLGTLRDQLTELQQSMSSTLDENDQLKAELHTVVNERDQLMARADGDRGRLQQISEKAQLELKAMIQGITSERNQLMQELQSAQTALQQAKHRDMADIPQTVAISGVDPSLLVSMVDSLRTPMTSIVGYIDLLISESAGLLSDMQRKFIQRISANTVRLETMLNDLSHLTALDTGTYELEREPVNVVNLLEDSLTNATYQFREKDLTVHLELDDTIPPLMLDRGAVHQVLGQLLTNAYLVTPAAGELAVSAAQMLDQSVIRVSITDSGPGIDEENRSEVFARRYRTEHQLVSGLGDTGVGLSIAKALIEAHGGRLWFDSVVGEGTTFFIELPLAAIDEGVG
jgi:signal transduction histidine kinase/predicted  nucleic acid-binding Zn-ribbon protein